MRRHLSQETPGMRAQWRREILATTRGDFTAFGERLATLHSDEV